MSSRLYITKAIVCGSRMSMTSDKSYLLFTQELGMLWATARSVRMEKSKQRYALQDFSVIRVSLVQGRSVWRIGSVEALSNPFLAASSRMSRGGVAYVLKAIRRYVHGQEVVSRTFSDAIESLMYLSKTEVMDEIATYQQIFMLRMLDELGYVKNAQDISVLLEKSTIQESVEEYDLSMDGAVTKSIEYAAAASHL